MTLFKKIWHCIYSQNFPCPSAVIMKHMVNKRTQPEINKSIGNLVHKYNGEMYAWNHTEENSTLSNGNNFCKSSIPVYGHFLWCYHCQISVIYHSTLVALNVKSVSWQINLWRSWRHRLSHQVYLEVSDWTFRVKSINPVYITTYMY